MSAEWINETAKAAYKAWRLEQAEAHALPQDPCDLSEEQQKGWVRAVQVTGTRFSDRVRELVSEDLW